MIFRSPLPDVAIPDEPLHSFVLERAADLAEKTAFIEGTTGRTLTYGELDRGIRAVSAGLAGRGFSKRDVVAIYSPNLPEYALAFFGVASAGGVNTTLNPLSTVEEVVPQIDDSGARFLVTVPALMERASEIAARTGIEEVFVFGEAEGATPFRELMEDPAGAPDVTFDPREDVVALPYSSGTTGLPKGVMLTHHNLVANICQYLGADPPREAAVVIAVLPFFHIYGMVVVMSSMLHSGATLVTLPRFDLETFLRTLEEHRVTRAYVVPPIALALAKHPLVDEFDLSTLEDVMSGAAPLGDEVARACRDRLSCAAYQGYGLTEASPVTHARPRHDPKDRLKSVGPSVPNTETCIVDLATGERLGPGQEGEVWTRGPQIMKGYLNQPEATAQTVDDRGWLHTGDIGYVDEDGFLFVVDRAKELIKYKGYQVAPAELEDILLGHPAVSDSAVIPSPDEEAGEVPKAFVVASGAVSEGELIDFVAERVAPYKKVRLLEFVEEIPKSPSGKILRRVLVERERERAAG